jgi:methylglutaconyl-CoA hydratase
MSELIQELSPNGVLRLMMNRPEIHNAFDAQQQQRLIDALEGAAENPEVKVIVIGGEGKSFSAGGDIHYMRSMGSNTYEQNLADAGRLAKLMKTLNFMPKPTIARVHGAAMGGGVGLVCCCDIAVGTPKARLALSEIKIGMVPATIAPYVVRSIGEKPARRFFMTGEMINAERAQQVGFLSEVVAEDALDDHIEEIAGILTNNAPGGFAKAKWIINEVHDKEIDDEVISTTVKFIADIRDSDEGREGLSAFLEKRKPNWQA